MTGRPKSVKPLTSSVVTNSGFPSQPSKFSCCACWLKCSVSRGILTILLWNLLVGITYAIVVLAPAGLIFQEVFADVPFWVLFHIFLGAHCLIGLVQMLYPVGGLLADVQCGRCRVITFSLFSVGCGFLCTAVVGIFFSLDKLFHAAIYIEITVGGLALIMFVIGFSGFQANIVQFGLDQLLDASSEELSLFLHWLVWTEYVGELVVKLLITSSPYSSSLRIVLGFLSVPFLIVITSLLVFSCLKRHWFHCENTVRNPYRNLYKVLKFATKHNRPVGPRSAVTYSDDVKPARIDFAKKIYGGPFVTEVVEDVKTCLRILVMLLAIAPLFLFEVPTYHIFPVLGVHIGSNGVLNFTTYSYEWMLFESGNLSPIITVVCIPLYILLLYPHIKKWVPRILYRMGLGAVLTVTSVTFMFIVQVLANYYVYHNTSNMANTTNITCLFLSEYRNYADQHTYPASPTLGFPSQALLVPNLLNGIAAPLLSITVLEFISAQSPHTMKGLLLGVFYAFRGLSITIGCVVTFPFAQEHLWAGRNGVFDCGFYYYLCNSVLGMIGLVVFVKAARWYRYRERDDPPYRHQYAEEYYSRHMSEPTINTRLVDEETNYNYGDI